MISNKITSKLAEQENGRPILWCKNSESAACFMYQGSPLLRDEVGTKQRELSTLEGPWHVYKYKTGCWDSGDKLATLTYRQTKSVSTFLSQQHNEHVNHRKLLVRVSVFPINDVSAFPVSWMGARQGLVFCSVLGSLSHKLKLKWLKVTTSLWIEADHSELIFWLWIVLCKYFWKSERKQFVSSLKPSALYISHGI